jgi:hypothetical protein
MGYRKNVLAGSGRWPLAALVLAFSTMPCTASIQYSYCTSGCTNNNAGMTYSAFQSAATAFANSFSSTVTFVSANLNGSGIYNDPITGTVFTGYNASQVQEPLMIGAAASLAQTGTLGQNRSIGISLPSDTYAVAMYLSVASGFASPFITTSLSDLNTTNANYSVTISNSSDSQFFGLISDTPLSSLFIGDLYAFQGPVRILSFEIGQQVATTPEPSTFILVGAGLLMVRVLRRDRRSPKA